MRYWLLPQRPCRHHPERCGWPFVPFERPIQLLTNFGPSEPSTQLHQVIAHQSLVPNTKGSRARARRLRGSGMAALPCSIGFPGADMPSSAASAGWWLLHHLSDQRRAWSISVVDQLCGTSPPRSFQRCPNARLLHWLTWIGCTAWSAAISWSVLRPEIASMAKPALNIGLMADAFDHCIWNLVKCVALFRRITISFEFRT